MESANRQATIGIVLTTRHLLVRFDESKDDCDLTVEVWGSGCVLNETSFQMLGQLKREVYC